MGIEYKILFGIITLILSVFFLRISLRNRVSKNMYKKMDKGSYVEQGMLYKNGQYIPQKKLTNDFYDQIS